LVVQVQYGIVPVGHMCMPANKEQIPVVAERVGRYVQQPTGYRAFIPAPLPPDPAVRLDEALLALLSHADQAVGRLARLDLLGEPRLTVLERHLDADLVADAGLAFPAAEPARGA